MEAFPDDRLGLLRGTIGQLGDWSPFLAISLAYAAEFLRCRVQWRNALTIKLRNRCGLGEGLLDCSVQTLDHAAGSSLCCHHAEPAPYLKAGDTALSQCRYIR